MKTTTEMKLVPIDKLIPYINNARTHNAEQINKLRSSLREFGFINPVIIDGEYNIIAGHGRVMAAKEEHIEEVPCVFADHLTPAQKKAYIIADNRMAQDAGWDEELLRIEIEALQAEAFDIGLTGFEEQEIADLFGNDEDKVKDDDFDLTVKLLEEIKPSLIHLSKYQHRKGAVSSSLKEIPHEVMKKRSKYLSEIKSKITEDENRELIGSYQKVLVVEEGSKGGFIAKTNSYIPVIVDDVELGSFVDVKITEATATYLKSELV